MSASKGRSQSNEDAARAAKKAARKEELKKQAEALGVSYKELKSQKKDKKRNKKREAESLESDDHKTEMKRMRTWSKDLTEEEPQQQEKRRRTRSMDAADETEISPEAWRSENNISIKGHGILAREKEFPAPYLKFRDAPFNGVIQKSFQQAGFEKPTAIQSQAWPIAIKGQDMICIAKTGSGKTCGFLLPSLHQHLGTRGPPSRGRMAVATVLLVLAPTRELACQIMEETQKFGRPLGVRSVCCYGGSSKWPQIAALERGVECIIATPGRLNDLLEMKKASLEKIKFVVLDEADRMLDMGFEPQIRSILKHVPDPHQTLLFSATWPKEIQRLAHDFLKDPIQINVGEVDALVANKDIKQNIVMCTEAEKFDKLTEILKELAEQGETEDAPKPFNDRYNNHRHQQPLDLGGKKHDKVIVFVAKKISCHELANRLWDDGFAVDSLHGDRPQWERTKVMNAFKAGTLRMLIATDVAARGLDVKDVGIVINYDMPAGVNAVEDYVHRIGRTGRAGAKGVATTLFTQGDRKCAGQLVQVMKQANQEIPAELQAMVPRPRYHGGGRGRGGGRGYMSGGGRGGRGYMGGGGGRYGGGGRGGYGGRGRGGFGGYGGRGGGGRGGYRR